MKRRKWDPKMKVMIVLQGLKGKPVAEICLEHKISQTQYYQWRDQFLANVHNVFTNDEKKGELLTREWVSVPGNTCKEIRQSLSVVL